MVYTGNATASQMWAGIAGSQDTRRIRYLVENATDENDALDLMEDATSGGAPFSYDNMPREDIEVQEISKDRGMYYATAIYTRRSLRNLAPNTNDVAVNIDSAPDDTPLEEDPDKELFSFEVSLNSNLEYQPRNATQYNAATNPTGQLWDSKTGSAAQAGFYTFIPFRGYQYDPDYGYRGLEIMRPQASFSLDIYPENVKVTRTYQKLITSLVGKVNSAAFRNYAAGEVMLVSARGESRNQADWRFSFRFEVRFTRANLDLGNNVVFPSVEGWDLVDPYYVERIEDLAGGKKAIFHDCRQAIVWRVYERADLAVIFV